MVILSEATKDRLAIDRECLALKARIIELEAENAALNREKIMLECRLEAVMISVDKWFSADDPRLANNEETRACDAREIALRAIEQARDELAALRAEREPSEQRKKDVVWLRQLCTDSLDILNRKSATYLSMLDIETLTRILDEDERKIQCTVEH